MNACREWVINMMSDPGVWLSLAALLLAGVVQGSSGFGFSLVSVGLMAMALGDAKAAAIIPVFPNLALCLFMMARYIRHLRVRLIVPFLCGSLTGVPLGVLFLERLDEIWVMVGIGVVLVGSGSYALLPKEHRRDWHPVWLGVPSGLASGGLAGAFNTGGPPAVAFMSNLSLDRYQFVSTLQFAFVIAGIMRVGSLAARQMYTEQILVIGLVGIIAALVGCLGGNWVLHRISDKQLRVYVCWFQILLGIIYLGRATFRLL